MYTTIFNRIKLRFAQFILGERANVIKHPDNLQPEGKFVERVQETWAPGERVSVVKHEDNLHMEGQIDTHHEENGLPKGRELKWLSTKIT